MLSTVSHALAVLKLFRDDRELLSLTYISNKMNLGKSTTHRLLQALVESGFMRQDPETRQYGLGYMVVELGGLMVSRLDIYRVAKPHLNVAAGKLKESLNIAVLDRSRALYVHHGEDGDVHLLGIWEKPVLFVGARLPLHATASGKVLLAFASHATTEEVLVGKLKGYTDQTITDSERLRSEILKVQKSGYAMSVGEFHRNITCIAAPIWDESGKVRASCSVSGVTERLRQQNLSWLTSQVRELATKISQSLSDDRELRDEI